MDTTIAKSSVTPATHRRVLRVAELERTFGIPQSTSYRRARPGGPWTRLAPGVVLVVPGPPSVEDHINAALLRAGPGAMVTGLHAARLLGLKTPPKDAEIHILIPHARKIQGYGRTRFERTTRLPEPVYVNGIPVAPPVRSILDGARTWQAWSVTERLLFEAVVLTKSCRLNELVIELELGSRRGTAVPRAILRAFRDAPTPLEGMPGCDTSAGHPPQRDAA